MTSSVEQIRAAQQALMDAPVGTLIGRAVYREFIRAITNSPDMQLVGCIDARLPIGALGMKHGMALVHRIPAAYLPQPAEQSIRTSLELAVKRKKITDIVVMGHTDCAAINECLQGSSDMPETTAYFAPLKPARDAIVGQHGQTEKAARLLEEESVRQSLLTILERPIVREAVKSGQVRLHGWVLDVHKAFSEPPQPFLDELDLPPQEISPDIIAQATFKRMVDGPNRKPSGQTR